MAKIHWIPTEGTNVILNPIMLLGGVIALSRNMGSIVIGGLFTMAAMQLWPQIMAYPYEWVGMTLQALGLT